jgi:Yip1-like protein
MDRSSPSPSAVAESGERDWWLRTLLVLQAPRAVFVALRDDSDRAAGERSEPVLAVILLAGIAGVLSTGAAGRLLDEPDYDGTLVAIWAFVGGGIYGVAGYWALGGLLHRSLRALGSRGRYRRARHLLAFACVPVACSLAVWLVKIAVFRGDAFRSGGSDSGAPGDVFAAIELGFLAWTVALLVIGVRAVEGWTWARAGSAVAAALVLPALFVAGSVVL